jgi:hypothetical protein
VKRFVPLIALVVIIGALLACGESSNTDTTANTSNASSTSDISATPSPTLTATPDSTLDSTQASDQQQQQPVQQPAKTTGVNGNPWGYDFNAGSLIYNPNSGFCNYFTCVSTFWTKTSGYVVECGNGKYSHSGGVKDVCSRDGGVQATLYQHP